MSAHLQAHICTYLFSIGERDSRERKGGGGAVCFSYIFNEDLYMLLIFIISYFLLILVDIWWRRYERTTITSRQWKYYHRFRGSDPHSQFKFRGSHQFRHGMLLGWSWLFCELLLWYVLFRIMHSTLHSGKKMAGVHERGEKTKYF